MSQNLEFQRKRAVRYFTGRVKPWALIFAVLVCAICFMLGITSVTPQKYEINEGDIAKETITATRDVVDEVTTQALQKQAEDEVQPIYKLDKQATEDSIQAEEDYFSLVEDVRAYSQQIYQEAIAMASATTPKFEPGEIKWNKYLTTEKLSELKQNVSAEFTDDEILMIAAVGKQALSDLRQDIVNLSRTELDIGIKQENLKEQALRITAQIMANTKYTESLRKIAAKALDCLKPNTIYDKDATNAEKDKAAKAVDPAVYKKGQNIVQAGEVVTKAQIEVLRDLGIKQENTINFSLSVGVLLYMLLCFVFFGAYVLVFNREFLKSIKYVLLTGMIIVITSGIAIPLGAAEPRIITVYLGTILTCILISPRAAMGVTVLLAFITGLIGAGGTGILAERMLINIIAGIAGGFTALLFLRKARHRTEYIYSGFAAGLINAIVFIMAALIGGNGFSDVLTDGMWALINGTASAVIAIGALPVLEAMFRIGTATRLLELLNPNQPLLKRLSLETPGTYHHSIIAANLAEAAAEAMDLNSLLVKAAAYYHDIGKLKKPEMFRENQQEKGNPHDFLEPRKSALVLREHVIFGKYLAIKYKLPKDIADMIEQHHGTSVMAYFYNKAREKNPDANPDEFRYKGPKPQTKEAMLLMMADCVEAAVRANNAMQKEQLKCVIHKLCRERSEDGQFDECDVTSKDLALMTDAFISVYMGMFHERIQYPEALRDAENHNEL